VERYAFQIDVEVFQSQARGDQSHSFPRNAAACQFVAIELRQHDDPLRPLEHLQIEPAIELFFQFGPFQPAMDRSHPRTDPTETHSQSPVDRGLVAHCVYTVDVAGSNVLADRANQAWGEAATSRDALAGNPDAEKCPRKLTRPGPPAEIANERRGDCDLLRISKSRSQIESCVFRSIERVFVANEKCNVHVDNSGLKNCERSVT